MQLVDGVWVELGTRALTGGYGLIPSGIPEAPTRVIFDIIDVEVGIVGQEETYAKETSEMLQGYA